MNITLITQSVSRWKILCLRRMKIEAKLKTIFAKLKVELFCDILH